MAARFLRRLAVVTDADSAMAGAVAVRLANEGASLVLQHRGDAHAVERARALASHLVGGGCNALAIAADLRDPCTLGLLSRAISTLGPRVDALVHTATARVDTRSLDDGAALGCGALGDVRASLARDVDSLLVASQLCAPLMQPGSAMVSLLSLSARDGGAAGLRSSAVSSGAALALVRTLARELGPRGIRINAIECDTERGAAQAGECTLDDEACAVSGTAAFLLSSDASYVTGTVVAVDGRGKGSRMERRPAAELNETACQA